MSAPPRPAPPGITAEQRPEILLRLGNDMLASGEDASALRLYQSAQHLAPRDAAPLVHIGDALSSLNDMERAEQAYRGALVLAPGNMGAQRGLALALIAQGRPSEALPILQGLDDGTTDVRVLRAEGTALDLVGQPSAAQSVYRRALQQAPVDAALHGNLALSLALSGNTEGALAEIKAATASPTPDPRQDANAVLVLSLVGQVAEARRRGVATIGPNATDSLIACAAQVHSIEGHTSNPAAVGVVVGTTPASLVAADPNAVAQMPTAVETNSLPLAAPAPSVAVPKEDSAAPSPPP